MKTMVLKMKKAVFVLTLTFAVISFVNAQTKTAVKVADLQKTITDQITKDYTGYAIKDAFKVVHNNMVSYEVNINKEKKNVCLAFDEAGKFLKVVEPKVAHAALAPASKPKSAAAPATPVKK